MSKMNSIERVIKAFKHQEGDRVPMDFSATADCLDKLYRYYNTNNLEDILEIFHIDFRNVRCEEDYYSPENPLKRVDEITFINHWDITIKEGGGVINPPLKDIESVKDIEECYNWPSIDLINIDKMLAEMERHNSKGYAVYGGMWAPFEHIGHWLLGQEKAMIMMHDNPDLYEYIMDKIVDFYLEANKLIFESARDKMQIYYMGNDYGGQRGLNCSLEHFKRFSKPHLKKLFGMAKEYGYYTCLHSCGAIKEIIPELIEIGVDCLNPIQVAATGMDIHELKKEYGQNIVLHGGICTQTTLPFGSKEEVKEEVLDRINNISKEGGYILAPSQDFLPDIPIENIVTVYEVGYQYGNFKK